MSKTKEYDVAFISPFTDTFIEIHACGCQHKKQYANVERLQYEAMNMDELKRCVEIQFNSDLASDNNMPVEKYVDGGLGYEAGTRVGDSLRIMPCVKF